MKEYLYIYRSGEEARVAMQDDSAVRDEIMQKWKNWMESLAAKGQLSAAGNPLTVEGRVLRGKAKKLTDGPFVEGKEIVGGYSIVKASSLDEATEIAKGCPVFDNNGLVEIRELGQMTM